MRSPSTSEVTWDRWRRRESSPPPFSRKNSVTAFPPLPIPLQESGRLERVVRTHGTNDAFGTSRKVVGSTGFEPAPL